MLAGIFILVIVVSPLTLLLERVSGSVGFAGSFSTIAGVVALQVAVYFEQGHLDKFVFIAVPVSLVFSFVISGLTLAIAHFFKQEAR